jgi:hypothetical protein
MKSLFLFFLFICILFLKGNAQNDTIQSNNLLGEILSSENKTQKLLPDRMIPTQRLFWGEKGLMRNFKTFNLTPEDRQFELKVRRTMLVSHQVMGFITLGGMVAQGIVGAKLYNGHYNLRDTHEGLAGFVNFGYFTTASLSLFAPPKMIDERKGYSSIKIHKALAIVHLSGMIATNILASQLESHPELKPYHRAAAYTTFGAFAASMIVIKF